MLDLSSRDRCFVIAEAGTAHQDSNEKYRFSKAIRLVEAACEAGADAIKFQWFSNPILCALAPDSWKTITDAIFCWMDGDSQRAVRWEQSVMSLDEWCHVKEFAERCGLVFLASTFQYETVKWLNKLGVVATKVASRAAKNFPYDSAPKPYLVSDGMGYPLPISVPRDNSWILQCEAHYPSTLAWEDDDHPWGPQGFSDHSGKPFLGIDAIARGCKLLEVHFKVDDIDAGPDLPACLSLDELKLVCEARDYYAQRKAA